MNYRYEYHGNPEYVTLHLTEEIAEGYVSESFAASEISKFRLGLFKSTAGIVEVCLDRYSVVARRGTAFERDAVLGNLLEVARMLFPGEEFTQLPTLRSDINTHQCAQCEAEQNEMMRQLARDFDTREY